MARKKDPELVHVNRARILDVAKELFFQHGIEVVKMSEIAQKAEMSKSTLYVYFKSKEELCNAITLEAMEYLYHLVESKLENSDLDFFGVYYNICFALVELKQKYPMSFQMLIMTIDVSDEMLANDPILKKIYDTGEGVNYLLIKHLSDHMKDMDMKQLLQIILTQWGAIYGMITLADQKEAYIEKSMGITKEEFLENGFRQLYQSMAVFAK